MLAQLTDVLSDGVSQDMWLLSVGIDNNSWGQYQPLIHGYKNWILNVIDDDKVFVRSIGNIQEHLKCHCGEKVCGKCPLR